MEHWKQTDAARMARFVRFWRKRTRSRSRTDPSA
uniref:Uncharacterized protein n=1 Tax=Anopheles minimus TaxID=112268 RepID=A0A182WJ16_9DIPT